MANAYMHVIIHAVDGMSASSYNGINGQALYMYVIMWTRQHLDISASRRNRRYYSLMGISAPAHRHGDNISADMRSRHHAIQCTNFYTLQEIKYYHYSNTCKYA